MTTAAPTGTPAAAPAVATTPATPPASTTRGPIAAASGASKQSKEARKAEVAAKNDSDWKAARAAAVAKPDIVSAAAAERLGIDDALEVADPEEGGGAEKDGESAETAEVATEGDETAVAGEAEAAKEEPKPPVEPVKPTMSEWKQFLKRKAETEERLEKRAARVGALETEAQKKADALLAEAQGKVRTFEAKIAAVAGLDSEDPFVVWDAIAKHKGWDAKEAFQTVTRRTLHGGELTVQDQFTAAERARVAREQELLKKVEQIEADRKKEVEENAKRDEAAQKQRQFEEAARGVASDFKAAIEAGTYRFLKRYTPEQVGEIAVRDLVTYFQRTGKEVPLDDYLKGWEHKLRQEYEALRGLDPESAGSSSKGSETGQGDGAAAAANPGTQQANGSPPRRPTTVTRSLAAQRSEQGRPLSDAEQWEEAKRLAKQREDAPR